ncbi:MAG: 30S ribosomal protein S20 [Chloroflexota bacterium]|nr:30S ribosomal protein S20 [Chloroflexota bacterium]MQG04667.1 30S ribosomal protein S20 [SAR202 cluster bacterium]|tara:strand:- start:7419 stop:7679 length:261 start_codon:yes stop_codon:yes gene_type:complete
MPSKKSLRTSKKNAAYNRPIASAAKTLVRSAKESIEEDPNSESTKNKIKEAISSLDKASQKGVLHKNNAARRKSRLIKKLSSGTKR